MIMVSNDFKNIMQKIHKDKYTVSRTEIHFGRRENENTFDTQATITLQKGGERLVIQTSEPDCILYIVQLRQIIETNGDILLAPVTNPEQYNNDIVFLIDQDKKRLESALGDLISKKFVFSYNPIRLIDELLESRAKTRMLDRVKYSPLLEDYFHILALILSQSEDLLRMHGKVEEKFSIQALLHAMEWMYTGFSLRTKNPIKNYRYFKTCLSFDSDMLFEQLSSQGQITEDVIKTLINGQKLNYKRDIPKLMDIYTRCLEPLRPLINLLRIGLELRSGVQSPEKQSSLGQNIAVLKADNNYGSLFNCLDEQIRHGDAHSSTFVKGDVVEIRNGLTRKSKVIRTFKGFELANIILEMKQQFFPALMTATVLNDYGLLDQLLVSPEYKVLLATIGNGRAKENT